MKRHPRLLASLAAALTLMTGVATMTYAKPADADNFYKSDKLVMEKVTFPNLYKMEMAGDLFLPQDLDRSKKYPAIIVGHPMGAVKEQSAVLYAQKLAEQGFVTLAMDLAFWGASQGQPRNAVSPDMMPRPSARPWTSSTRSPMWTGAASASSASAAAAASPSAPPRSTPGSRPSPR